MNVQNYKLDHGELFQGEDGTVVQHSPATGVPLHCLKQARAPDIAAAAAVARAAQKGWAALPYEQRATIMRKAADLLESHQAEFSEWVVSETGGIGPKAGFEIGLTVKALREASAMPSQPNGLVLPTEPNKISFCRRVPLGVVGVIAPFNFPMYLSMRAVAPALAIGNAVVLKPDPRTAVCGGLLLARLLETAGLPVGVLHVLPGDVDAGEALCTDPNVAMIQFTGSTAAGRKVGALAGGHLKKVSLELGGKNALIVLDDADLDLAASNAAWASFLHQGQICMTGGKILVQAAIHDKFVEKLAQKAANLPVGDPTGGTVAIGPMISHRQADRVSSILADTIADGARLLAGGRRNGLFLDPAVIAGVTPAMRAYKEEIFGPVAVVAAFDDDDDAIAMANDTEYGLSAGIITSSVGRAMAIGERLNAGLLHINDQTVGDEVVNPFGGRGMSGNGTSIGGPANWDEFSQWQWVTMRPAPIQYPF